MRSFSIGSLILFASIYAHFMAAQVSGLSYTLSPTLEYNWFNNSSGLTNGYLAGAQLGFGFGEYVELRGHYQRSYGLQTDLEKFTNPILLDEDGVYAPKDVLLERIGGELKLNIGRGKLLPYLLAGTGVQSTTFLNVEKNRQIYLNGGLGILFSAANRYTIGLQGLRTSYKLNPYSSLLTEGDRTTFDVDLANTSILSLSNYALRASLVFYIGGRKPGELTAIDKAYIDNFSGGFRGLSIPVEPSLIQLNFHEDFEIDPTLLAGGSVGINMGPLVGVRGFYWRGVEDLKNSKLQDIALYGGEGRFKLNEGKGFTPWISLGGGQMDFGEEYRNNNDEPVRNKAFAMAGLGLNLPFSKYVNVSGHVRSLLTASDHPDNVAAPTDIQNSWAYGVSANFTLGKRANDIKRATSETIDEYLSEAQMLNDQKLAEKTSSYDLQIVELEEKLQAALVATDFEKAAEIKRQQEILELIKSTERQSEVPNANMGGENSSVIKMTPSEFQLLVQEFKKEAVPNVVTPSDNDITSKVNQQLSEYKLEQSLEAILTRLEKLEAEQNIDAESNVISNQKETASEDNEVVNQLNKEIKRLEKAGMKAEMDLEAQKIENKYAERIAEMKAENEDLKKRIKSIEREAKKASQIDELSNQELVQTSPELKENNPLATKIRYKGMSGFVGFGLDENATFNIGYRLYYDIGVGKSLSFMPETFFGLGSPSSFGIMANAVYDLPVLKEKEKINPYVGVGIGLMNVAQGENEVATLKGAYNFMIGSSLDVWNGDLFVDYTSRNGFKVNQLVVGYRFPF